MAVKGSTRPHERQWTAHQKAGQITVFLVQGSKMTTMEIARLTGMTFMGAKYMMEMLSMVLPIEHVDSQWRWMQKP
jgi:hypothetical protein